jgi:hypothetical protein
MALLRPSPPLLYDFNATVKGFFQLLYEATSGSAFAVPILLERSVRDPNKVLQDPNNKH